MDCSVRTAETQLAAICNLRLVKIRPASGRSDLVPRIILSQRSCARARPGDPCKADANRAATVLREEGTTPRRAGCVTAARRVESRMENARNLEMVIMAREEEEAAEITYFSPLK